MDYLVRDDILLQEEGLGSLSKEELVESCSQRGLRVVNMDREELIEQLREWHVASACAPDSPATLCCVAVLMFHRCASSPAVCLLVSSLGHLFIYLSASRKTGTLPFQITATRRCPAANNYLLQL